ncbi:MAG: pyruvate ferredoxin oxidoreductase [Nitrososphaeria archaeon]|nr:pyruvate ferredoxin oxidoreductase [Nitrososphaeria archaeon]NIN53413.1 pyruvate ferredoxin oxidoreductase [Nitrososphaeria archaeon]NIQ33925.1 pyruvate ferredoxin oxidoreductase [Nitrososphaeria archaeon]
MQWIIDTGNHAAAIATKLARVQVISAYPITPQTSVVELLSEFIEKGDLDARFIQVESEHSALAAIIGASLMGTRVFTATSSHGLALMHEMLHWASGSRTPIVMAVVNRAIGPPWSIWPDHMDTVAQRDTGWIQFYVKSNQEVFDSIIQAYRIAEDRRVSLPSMICFEGFSISHTSAPFKIPEQGDIDDFLPSYRGGIELDFENPVTFGNMTFPEHFDQFRVDISEGMDKARNVIKEVSIDYSKQFGVNHGDLIEKSSTEDTDIYIVAMGAVASEAFEAVKRLREEGEKVGGLRVRVFRPFPAKELSNEIREAEAAVVLDRSISPGSLPPLYSEVRSTLYSLDIPVYGVILGIGGRDVTFRSIKKIYRRSLSLLKRNVREDLIWYRN